MAPVVLKDMWWPDDNDAADSAASRGVMTHEYGHFWMCSYMFHLDGPSAMSPLISRMSEGQNDSRDDYITLATEAFADVFTMQVVGGANYVDANGATDGRVKFCRGNPCMDQNYSGSNDYVPSEPLGFSLYRQVQCSRRTDRRIDSI